MTAPDPGLTDLIAAALVRSSPNSIDTFDLLPYHRQEAWRVRAREVALVVEQHTNGRIAELEAYSRRTAFEDQDRIDELTVRMRRAEDEQDALKAEASGLRYDNEQLQATIARVKALVQDDDGDWLPYWRATTTELRAALEGES